MRTSSSLTCSIKIIYDQILMSDSYVVILIGRNSAVSVVLQGFK